MSRALDAAGITDPRVRESYARCKRLNRTHGRTYYLATLLLPAWKRPYVHALYGFARYADDIVDNLASTLAADDKAAWLTGWGERFLAGDSDGDVLPAIHDTIARWHIPHEHFEVFLASMRMDLTITEYRTYDDLMAYVYGSAAVIGRQMLPVLEPLSAAAESYAQDLGVAFQLTNFIRDVGEDLRRGRIYLPLADLDQFGVTRERLLTGVVDAPVRRLLAYEIDRTREIFRGAQPGIALLHPSSRPCIQTAFTLYGEILDAVEAADYQVLDRRVSVPITRRLAAAAPAYLQAYRARKAGIP